MASSSHYAIRGGTHGRERLRLLAHSLRPSTAELFNRLGISEGLTCLDVGCGGGDVTLELARRVGPRGLIVGIDIDEAKLALARSEAQAEGVEHVSYRLLDVRSQAPDADYDVVYARFLLSHLPDPDAAVGLFHRHTRAGGLAILEDIDYRGCFTGPESDAYVRYHALCAAVIRARRGNPDVGARLPSLLLEAGFDGVDVRVVQPAALRGDLKFIHSVTLENVTDAVVAEGLASREECDRLLVDLREFAADPRTLVSFPRIVQAWGRRGA